MHDALRPAVNTKTVYRVTAVVTVLLANACASVNEPIEQELAAAGVRTTQVLAKDVHALTQRLEQGDAAAAFVATWNSCKISEDRCSIAVPSDGVQAQRIELASVVALRAQAIDNLNRAYEAYRAELQRKPGANVELALRDAVSGTVSYASSVSRLPLGGAARITRPLERAAGLMISAAAAQKRRKSLSDAGTQLRDATAALREALTLETRKFDALAEAIVRERIEAHRALLQAGLVSGTDSLRTVADGLRVPIARDADAVVARSATARTAVEAVIEASERADVHRTQARYRAAIEALGELQRLHDGLGAGAGVNLNKLDQALWKLDHLADPLFSPRSPATSTAPSSTMSASVR